MTPQLRQDVLARLTHLAPKVTPYLAPAALEEVWLGLGLDGCAAQDEAISLALALHQAIAARDAQAMQDAGERWLELRIAGTYPEAETVDETALLALLMGHASQGGWSEMHEVERRYGQRFPPTPNGTQLRALLYWLAMEK
jgi:hypothetical protein